MAKTMTALLKDRKAQMPTYKKDNPAGAREGSPGAVAGPGGGQAVKASPPLPGESRIIPFLLRKQGVWCGFPVFIPFLHSLYNIMKNLLSIEQLTGDEIKDLLALGHKLKGGNAAITNACP